MEIDRPRVHVSRGGTRRATSRSFSRTSTMHKVLLASATDDAGDVRGAWARSEPFTDFRPITALPSGGSEARRRPEGGEYKNAAEDADGEKQFAPERRAASSHSAVKRSSMTTWAHSRHGNPRPRPRCKLTDRGRRLLRAARVEPVHVGRRRAVPRDAQANIDRGAALSVANIEVDRIAMANAARRRRERIPRAPPAKMLLLPVGARRQARVINSRSTTRRDREQGATEAEQGRRPLRDIIDTARLTGTRRYSFADPGIAPVIEVAFLDGSRSAAHRDAATAGASTAPKWKVASMYGVGAIDFRGAVTNAGAKSTPT
jgi:hypothetical protein